MPRPSDRWAYWVVGRGDDGWMNARACAGQLEAPPGPVAAGHQHQMAVDVMSAVPSLPDGRRGSPNRLSCPRDSGNVNRIELHSSSAFRSCRRTRTRRSSIPARTRSQARRRGAQGISPARPDLVPAPAINPRETSGARARGWNRESLAAPGRDRETSDSPAAMAAAWKTPKVTRA